ncbi:hypothetical protein RhiXN_01696 [Rhizoctonia solani]|uniref:Uncharacterized protein n=1 Tax=Rhizoctonia solani TaxID=456999 RepID=A0A8H8T234_9AGAM|nr:uncharacterized protein RhiXN_01696 [Rhizoctonia solani]QRW27101.1 hypothetical protein RhiXN_01696 [Rhizoctonia solani]
MLQHDAVQAVLDTILLHTPNSLEASCFVRTSTDITTSRRYFDTNIYLCCPSFLDVCKHEHNIDRHSRNESPLENAGSGPSSTMDAYARDAPLSRTLAPHVNRVKQLWIQTASVHTEAFLKSIAGGKTSQLERLVVTGRYTDDHPLELPPNLLSRLKHLSLTHAFLAPTPVPTNLLSLSLKPPPGAPPLPLSTLTALLKESPNLTDLSLFGNAVPIYKPGDPQQERIDLSKLKTLKVASVNPVQAAWLLFHISHPSGTLLTLDLEPSRPLRTISFDRPRAPDFSRPRPPGELESYYAVLTMFRGGAIPLETITLGPAISESKQQQVIEVKQVGDGKQQDTVQEEEITTEKLSAQYTSSTSTLSLAAGSRATEALARLLSTPVQGVSKLCVNGLKLSLERLEEVKRGGEEGCQIRTIEIRACSLPILQKGERPRTNEFNGERPRRGPPPPTPSQTSPTSGPGQNPTSVPQAQPSTYSSPKSNTLSPPQPQPANFSNPYSSTGFPTPSPGSATFLPAATTTGYPTPAPQHSNFPIWTPYTASHELTTPWACGGGFNGVGGRFDSNGTGSNGDTLNSPLSSEGGTTTTGTAVPEQEPDVSNTEIDPNLSSSTHSALSGSVHSTSGDTTLASIASSEDANHLEDEQADEGEGNETGSEISDTDAVVNLNATEAVGERRRSSLGNKGRPGKLRDDILAKLREDVLGKAREDVGKTRADSAGKSREADKARTNAGSDKNLGGGSSTAGTVGTGGGSGSSTPMAFATPAAQIRGLPGGASQVNDVNGGVHVSGTTSTVQTNGTQTNGLNTTKPLLPSATSAPLLSTTALPTIPNTVQPQLSRVATAPQLDQLKLKSNHLRPSNSSSSLRKPLGFAPYASSVAVTGFGIETNVASTNTRAPLRSPTFPFSTQPSFHTLRHPGDPDIRLLTILSFHMPQLEELRIVRSTIRGAALIKFIESRNNCSEEDDGSDSDSESGKAGPGTPILMLELVECPYVSAEHVRVLRESVDDVRWKAYTYIGVAGGV